MKKEIFKAVLILLTIGVLAAAAWAQTTTTAIGKLPNNLLKGTDSKNLADKDKAPVEVAIPEAREDKVRLIQVKLENIQLKQQQLVQKVEEQLKASKEWKELEAAQQDAITKLQVELVSAMKAAGLTEKDFDSYKYDQNTLKFTLKQPEATTKKE